MRKLLTISKGNAARNLGLALLFIVPVVLATSCKEKETPCSDYTNPDCENYDPCWQAKQDYNLASENYSDARKECLQHYLPRCIGEIEDFKSTYDYCLPRDDSLLSVINAIKLYGHHPEYFVGHEALVDSARQSAIRAMDLEAVMDSVYSANESCLQ